jgi:uncharacterized membrane protein
MVSQTKQPAIATARHPDGAPETAPTLFSALLVPHRSLAPLGFNILIGFIITVFAVMGYMFWSIGAWPVLGFCGLDLALIWFAFHVNYRSAKAYEEVEVARTHLRIRQVDPRGRERHHEFNPFWTRFKVDRHDEIGITRMAVSSKGSEVNIGSFLNPDDRESFAEALGHALARARA